MHDDSQQVPLPSQLISFQSRMLLALYDEPKIGQEELSRHLDVASRTVPRYIDALERDGYLSVDRQQKPHRYTVLLEDSEIVALRQLVRREEATGPQGAPGRRPRRVLACQPSSDRRTMRLDWLWDVLFPPSNRSTA